MTASPPWTPREAPPAPTYPLTDADVLDEPVPVERFGPPQQAKPTLFERVRDRLAVRRALSRSAGEYDDAVQIVSGTGAPLRTGGRTRGEVGRRRQETMRMEPGAIPSDAAEPADPGDEVDLGPLPPTNPFVSPGATPMPRPGQLPLPGSEDAPGHPVLGTPLPRGDTPPHPDHEQARPSAPIPPRPELPLTPRPLPPLPVRPDNAIPPPRHTLDSVLGAAPPRPPAPAPDPLAEALSDFERDRNARMPNAEPRPWRPREIPEDTPAEQPQQAPEPRRLGRAAAAIHRYSPSQLRESRRLLLLFGLATVVMLLVGIVSGRTTTPLPNNTTARSSSSPAPAQQPASSQPAANSSTAPQPSAAAPQSAAPKPQASTAPASAPSLNGAKVIGDGGTGYQVSAFRYGQHPNDFRVVLDMGAAGTATGTPKATIGFLDPTTMLVVLENVVPAGSTGSLPNTSTVTGVTLVQPSPFPNSITYQFKLARPVQFSGYYMTGPLRLVLDLAG